MSESKLIATPDGSKEWWLNGERHREDGPACEYSDGSKEWWLNGKLHREDGPAFESPDGSKAWYMNGERHREDGPAAEYSDGTNLWSLWFLNGKELTKTEWLIATEKDPDTKAWLMLQYG